MACLGTSVSVSLESCCGFNNQVWDCINGFSIQITVTSVKEQPVDAPRSVTIQHSGPGFNYRPITGLNQFRDWENRLELTGQIHGQIFLQNGKGSATRSWNFRS